MYAMLMYTERGQHHRAKAKSGTTIKFDDTAKGGGKKTGRGRIYGVVWWAGSVKREDDNVLCHAA